MNASQDFVLEGQLSGVSAVAWAANSQIQHETAVMSGDFYPANPGNTQLQIYSDTNLQLLGEVVMPSFSANGTTYMTHGRYVFWNAAATKLFAFSSPDPYTGILSNYTEYTVEAPASLPPCTFSVSPTILNVGPGYSYATFFNVASACSWGYDASGSYWAYPFGTITPVTGSASVVMEVQGNGGAARSTTLTIAGQTVTVNQSASTCTYTLSSSAQTFSQIGGTGSVALTTDPSCAWTIQSSTAWLTVTSPTSGSGPATIQYAVAPNPAVISPFTAASGTLYVAGSATFSVSQQYEAQSLSFVPVTPCRVADTRNPTGPFGAPYVAAGTTRTLNLPSSSCGIPATAEAYSLNVTVVPHHGLSYLTLWPTGISQPFVSLLNSDGRVKAVAAIVPAGANGSVNFFATDDTELIVDINGYFIPATSTALSFYPLTPCRVADTRTANGTFGGPLLSPGQTRDFPVLASSCAIPTNAQTYSLNFTAVPQTTGIGFLSTWPTGLIRPGVSTLNDPTVTVVANAAIVPAGTNGDINVYSSDVTNLVVDINGYFAPPSSAGLYFHTLSPCRVLDTRSNGTNQPLTGSMSVQVAGSCGVPATAQAVVLTTTVVPVTSLGYLSLWPSGSAQPLVSTLNADDEVITSNMAIVPMSSSGAISAYASSATHLILDISGYFAP